MISIYFQDEDMDISPDMNDALVIEDDDISDDEDDDHEDVCKFLQSVIWL